MKEFVTSPLKGAACRVTAAVLLLLAAASAASAQGRPPASAAPGRINPKDETQGRTNREAVLRSAEMGATAGQVNQKQLAAAIEQTKSDFKRIQLLRNELVDRLVAKQPLDYKLLAEQAGEINKRANRLKSFLMKPAEVEKKGAEAAPVEYDEAGVRSALVKLCNTIYSFTGNPMFKNPEVVDAQQPAKAGGELLAIIEISENVRRSAERRAKASK